MKELLDNFKLKIYSEIERTAQRMVDTEKANTPAGGTIEQSTLGHIYTDAATEVLTVQLFFFSQALSQDIRKLRQELKEAKGGIRLLK